MFKQLKEAFEREFIGQPKVWYPVKDTIYYGRMSDAEIEALKQARINNWLLALNPPPQEPPAEQGA